ncbi:potassium channel protein [Ornithinimicrobium pratense]|uniref:Potassium transporter n=1 Tax=Ornithinimicrobium pratense TaxID=2593973 RepID=A0A5J6V2S0_9MICO|nr:potassium channel protein [Ornithinimicrobium pratense]QFG67451.1 potassium transporter [Ornithinimicrobium pratense]
MANLLKRLRGGRPAQPRPDSLRRVEVDIPAEPPSTDALFMVLRRMRTPLVVVISVFAVMTFGLSVIPGTPENPRALTVFESFYVISYTGLTIGFGEVPHEFSTQQRMWVVLTIYAAVGAWSYSIASLLALVQDQTFRQAIALQRFTRQMRRVKDPFVLVVGYGHAGEAVCRALDDQGRAFVVLDQDNNRIQQLALDGFTTDHPAYAASGRDPRMLGLAGLASEHCEAVVALTDNDETNLSVVMTVNLLRPELMVIARSGDREHAQQMHDFAANVIINPFDRYGAYLVMALRRPHAFRLASWLMSKRTTELPDHLEHLTEGRWVVCADDTFGFEVTRDLESAGLDVVVVDPADGRPDVKDAVGFVAGARSDIINLALAAHARIENSELFIAVRQNSTVNEVPLTAFDPDSVFIPTQLLAREAVARITSPNYWSFVDHALHEDDEWCEQVMEDIVSAVGVETPVSQRLDLNLAHAPAAVRWMRSEKLRIKDLLRDPEDRDVQLAAYPAVLVRDGRRTYSPDLGLTVQEDDTLLLLGRGGDLDLIVSTLFDDSAVEYIATGREVASAWAFRRLQVWRWSRRGHHSRLPSAPERRPPYPPRPPV